MQKKIETCQPGIVVKNAIERPKDASGKAIKGAADNGKALFSVEFITADARELPDDALSLILWEAAVNFCCRTGKQAEKLKGKHLSVEEVAAYLATTGSREGGPSQNDKDMAAQRMVVVKADAHKKAHDVDENDPLYGDVDSFIIAEIKLIGERNAVKFEGLSWAYDDDNDAVTNLATLYRACRLWKPTVV